MLGFHFRETMAGSYSRDGVERPMRFSAVARAASLLHHMIDRRATLDGTVDMDGFATAQPLIGEMRIDPLFARVIAYQFGFSGDDGRRYRFIGQKDIRLRDLVGSWTTLPGRIVDAEGSAVASAELRFDTAGLPAFLRSFRADIG